MPAPPNARAHASPPGAGTSARIRRWHTLVKVPGEMTEGRYAVLEHALEPGLATMPVHSYATEVTTYYALAGTVTVLVDGEPVRVEPSASLVVGRGVAHAVMVRDGDGAGRDGAAPARFLAVVAPAGLERYYVDVAAIVPVNGAPDMPAVHEMSARYGVTVDMASLLALVERYGVHLA